MKISSTNAASVPRTATSICQPRSPAADAARARAAPSPRSRRSRTGAAKAPARRSRLIGPPSGDQLPVNGPTSGSSSPRGHEADQLLQVLLACRCQIIGPRQRAIGIAQRLRGTTGHRSSRTPAKCHFNSRFPGGSMNVLVQHPGNVDREQRDRAVDHGLERGPCPERQHRRRVNPISANRLEPWLSRASAVKRADQNAGRLALGV